MSIIDICVWLAVPANTVTVVSRGSYEVVCLRRLAVRGAVHPWWLLVQSRDPWCTTERWVHGDVSDLCWLRLQWLHLWCHQVSLRDLHLIMVMTVRTIVGKSLLLSSLILLLFLIKSNYFSDDVTNKTLYNVNKYATDALNTVTVSDRPSAEVSHWERVQKRPVFSDETSTVTKWLIVTGIGENDTIVWKAVLWRHDVAYVSTNYWPIR